MTRYETPERPTEVLFGPRGRLSLFARDMRMPIGTIWSWKDAGHIPTWRRRSVLDAVNRLGIDIPPETIAYLAQAA